MVKMTKALSFVLASFFPILAIGVEVAKDPVFLTSAGQVNNNADLQQWKDEQTQHVQTSVPLAHQQFALDAIAHEYSQRVAQIDDSVNNPSSGQSMPAFLFLTSAKRCQTLEELHAWHNSQREKVKQAVPREYQQISLESIEGEYQKHSMRLMQSDKIAPTAQANVQDLPVLQINAEEYNTKPELEDWRTQQSTQIERFVPSDFQQIALNSVDREFRMRVADLDAVNLASTEVARTELARTFGIARLGGIVGLAALVGMAVRIWKSKATEDTGAYLLHEEQGTA